MRGMKSQHKHGEEGGAFMPDKSAAKLRFIKIFPPAVNICEYILKQINQTWSDAFKIKEVHKLFKDFNFNPLNLPV